MTEDDFWYEQHPPYQKGGRPFPKTVSICSPDPHPLCCPSPWLPCWLVSTGWAGPLLRGRLVRLISSAGNPSVSELSHRLLRRDPPGFPSNGSDMLVLWLQPSTRTPVPEDRPRAGCKSLSLRPHCRCGKPPICNRADLDFQTSVTLARLKGGVTTAEGKCSDPLPASLCMYNTSGRHHIVVSRTLGRDSP